MAYDAGKFDVIVIGAGHAGCEAALAAARMGCATLLVTMSVENVALMPCNPSIGGPAKAQLVREIDALGGEMARNIDQSRLQIRMINTGKGPAVQALRAQADKSRYHAQMLKTLQNQENLSLLMAEVTDLLVDDSPGLPAVTGIVTRTGARYACKTLVVTGGTYLKGRIIIGDLAYSGGPNNQAPASSLSAALMARGIRLGRFKTGTPPRIDRKTVDFSKMTEQPGSETPLNFSYMSDPVERPQLSCWLTHSNSVTHDIVRQNLDRAPMFTGLIEGIGPRYCPSFEDKVVRFAHKDRHQLFVEPEGFNTDEMYVQGLNTSLPEDVQLAVLRSIPGLENVRMVRTGYAIEYDYIPPSQLSLSLETRPVANLFSAGQINGTSGYEEAAAQGLVAGINAALRARGQEPFILRRSEAFIGVMIDDLVNKDLDEPYRLLSSRSEYRLLLRQDNADLRLTPRGRAVGLVDDARWQRFEHKLKLLREGEKKLRESSAGPADTALNALLSSRGSAPLRDRVSLWELLRRPEVFIDDLTGRTDDAGNSLLPPLPSVLEQLEIQAKYEGYLHKQEEQVARFERLENKPLPEDMDYDAVYGLANEARARLKQVRPRSVGQASRLAGVNPADVNILLICLEKRKHGP
ncbi:MAG: tRNA uridine-5-carboxymethylaminomethyl(34) synthesis enzyme MnmG [Syntrophomonadaceae bacterium]|nr:tRNA uridine-5-carboxymethylaminomethyl(34) synthesis enzyme MnmG [Syntrophomonadaceae bacterium]